MPPPDARDDDDPFVQLERCHRKLEERLAEVAHTPEDADARGRFFGFLDRSIRRHEDDEEASLFPRLSGRAELAAVIDTLRAQHRAQAELQRALRDAKGEEETVRALGALADAYRAHVEIEERVLFPAARGLLDAEAKRGMWLEMQARRGREGGDGEGRGRREGGGGGGGGGRFRA